MSKFARKEIFIFSLVALIIIDRIENFCLLSPKSGNLEANKNRKIQKFFFSLVRSRACVLRAASWFELPNIRAYTESVSTHFLRFQVQNSEKNIHQ